MSISITIFLIYFVPRAMLVLAVYLMCFELLESARAHLKAMLNRKLRELEKRDEDQTP